MNWFSTLVSVDGVLFSLVAVVVFVTPSPEPALRTPLDPASLEPFKDTRRLLAAMFLASGLLLLVIGCSSVDLATLRLVALARLVSFALVAAVNVWQLRRGRWKAGPLVGLLSVWGVLGAAYLFALLR